MGCLWIRRRSTRNINNISSFTSLNYNGIRSNVGVWMSDRFQYKEKRAIFFLFYALLCKRIQYNKKAKWMAALIVLGLMHCNGSAKLYHLLRTIVFMVHNLENMWNDIPYHIRGEPENQTANIKHTFLYLLTTSTMRVQRPYI